MHDYDGGGGGLILWWHKQIIFFTKCNSFETKKKTTNNYLLYIFAITNASVQFHSFPLDLAPAVLLKLIICLLYQVFH